MRVTPYQRTELHPRDRQGEVADLVLEVLVVDWKGWVGEGGGAGREMEGDHVPIPDM